MSERAIEKIEAGIANLKNLGYKGGKNSQI
jgi:hypothetical protein